MSSRAMLIDGALAVGAAVIALAVWGLGIVAVVAVVVVLLCLLSIGVERVARRHRRRPTPVDDGTER